MTSKRIPIVLAALLLLASLAPAAAELSVAQYVELAIERLELAQTTWSDEGRPPSADEETALCEAHGTTGKEFYAFAGKHREAVAAYLEDNPELVETIQSLSDAITAAVEQSETEE